MAATCGWGGVTDNKREGDGATPRGAHSIVGLYYRPDRMSRPVPMGTSPFFRVTFGVTTHSIKPITHFVVRH